MHFTSAFLSYGSGASCRKIVTQRLEDFRHSKFPVEEDGVVVGVKVATHPDQNHLHGA